MMANRFDVFISFSMTDINNQHSRSYFEAKRLFNILNNLLGIPSYFCDKYLSDREDPDFQRELMNRVANARIFIMILLDYSDTNKPYFKSEREKFVETHQESGSFIILANQTVVRRISSLDVMHRIHGHPDIFDINDIGSYQRFLNLVNTLAFPEEEKRKVNKIKICKKCHKIFHDGNEKGTVCVYHPGKLVISRKDSQLAYFSCCNQTYQIENENDIVDISPGCCEDGS